MLILIVASGPDKGRIYELSDGDAVVAGREGDRIQLNDSKASRRHAQLWSEGGTWYIRDCGSRHGTHRNQKPVEGKTQLKDGDRLQIGHTVFVLARMPAEQAERAALLGAAPQRGEAEASLPKSMRPRRRYVTATAAVLAALLIIGANLALLHQTRQLQKDVNDTRTATRSSNETLLAEVRGIQDGSSGDAPAGSDATALRNALAKVHEQQVSAREQLAQIRKTLANKPSDSRPLLDAILAQTEAQKRQANVLAGLRETIQQQQAQTTPTLKRLANAAQAAQANRDTLDQLHEQVLAQAENAAHVPQDLRETMDGILAELKDRPSIAQVIEPLQNAVASSQGATRQKLEQVLARLDAHNDLQRSVAQLRDQLAEQQAALAQNNKAVQRQVAGLRDRVASQPEALGERMNHVLAAVEQRDEQRKAVLDSIAQLKQSLPTDVTPLVQKVLQNQRENPQQPGPSAERIAEAVAAATEPNTALRKQLASLEAQLRANMEQTAGLPEAAQRLAVRQNQTSQQLDAVLQAVRRDEALAKLSADVQKLAEAQANENRRQAAQAERMAQVSELSATTQARLDDLVEAVRQQDALAELNAQVQELAAAQTRANAQQAAQVEQFARMAKLSQDTQTKLSDVLNAVRRDDALNELSAQVQKLAEAAQSEDGQQAQRIARVADLSEATQAKLDAVLERVQDAGAVAELSEHVQQLAAAATLESQQQAAQAERVAQVSRLSEATQAKLDQLLQTVQREDALKELSTRVNQLAATEAERRAEQAERTNAVSALAQTTQATQRQLDQLLKTVQTVRSEEQAGSMQSTQARAEQLARIERMVAALPSAQRAHLSESMQTLAQAMQDQSQQTGQALAQLREAVQQRPTDQRLAAQLEALNEAQARRSSALGEELLAQFERQPAVSAKLAHLGRLIEQQPQRTRSQIENALSQLDVPEKSGQTDQRKVLKAIDELKQAMPSNLTPLVEQVLAAVRSQPRSNAGNATGEDAAPAQTKALAQALHQLRSSIGQDMQELRRVVRSQSQNGSRMAANQNGDSSAGTSNSDADAKGSEGRDDNHLTKTEMAYKLAFQTGEPVTIGAGVVNPATGEVSEGRTLDPASAKAAGIDNWRAWYRMDSVAERMRLQKQAREYAKQKDDGPNVIDLPDTNARGEGTAYASPSEDAAKSNQSE